MVAFSFEAHIFFVNYTDFVYPRSQYYHIHLMWKFSHTCLTNKRARKRVFKEWLSGMEMWFNGRFLSASEWPWEILTFGELALLSWLARVRHKTSALAFWCSLLFTFCEQFQSSFLDIFNNLSVVLLKTYFLIKANSNLGGKKDVDEDITQCNKWLNLNSFIARKKKELPNFPHTSSPRPVTEDAGMQGSYFGLRISIWYNLSCKIPSLVDW